MFQCTVSKAHVLKAGIFETLEQVDSSINPAFYVVVPSQVIFDDWTQEMMVPNCLNQLQKRFSSTSASLSNAFCHLNQCNQTAFHGSDLGSSNEIRPLRGSLMILS